MTELVTIKCFTRGAMVMLLRNEQSFMVWQMTREGPIEQTKDLTQAEAERLFNETCERMHGSHGFVPVVGYVGFSLAGCDYEVRRDGREEYRVTRNSKRLVVMKGDVSEFIANDARSEASRDAVWKIIEPLYAANPW